MRPWQYNIQYIKIAVAGIEVESILTILRHQWQVTCNKALKNGKQEYSQSNDDKVRQFFKIKDQRIDNNNENVPNINLQNEEMMQLGKAYCNKNGEKLGIMKYQLWKNHYEV